MSNSKILVVGAAIVRKDEKFLIAQRDGTNRFIPYLWEFPGGKLEQGETLPECIRREILEEIGIDITVTDFFQQVIYDYGVDFRVELNAYLCQWVAGEAQALNCQAVRWISLDQFAEFQFAPADLPIVEQLIKTFRD
jgi:mutator protein MutT